MRISARFKAILFTVWVVASQSAYGLAAEQDDFMRVYMNQAKVLKLDRPVAKVILGNASVADATVADAQTIILTGKAYGATNLVLLDAAGNALLDERILVSVDENNTLRVFRQTQRTVYSCTPSCEEHQANSAAATAN